MEPIYRLEEVRKSYAVDAVSVEALRGVSLEIAKQEVVALIGPSGSGKSTLLNVLGLLESTTKGSMQFCGRETSQLSDAERTWLRRHSIGFVFQNFNLIPILTALENVEYALYLTSHDSPGAIKKRALGVLEAVGIGKFSSHRPAQLSGGQRQRVAIARALVKNPRVILADEPTANLDSKTSDGILELIASLRKNYDSTVILATHDSKVAHSCNRLIQLKDGLLEKTEARRALA